MTARQIDHLVRMANQIALNMAAWGDEEAVAAMTAEHMKKFWTPAMLRRLAQYHQQGGDELSAVVQRVVRAIEAAGKTEGETV